MGSAALPLVPSYPAVSVPVFSSDHIASERFRVFVHSPLPLHSDVQRIERAFWRACHPSLPSCFESVTKPLAPSNHIH